MQERTRTNPVCKSIWKLMSPFEASIINQTTTTTYYCKWKFLTFSNSKLSWKNEIQLELKSTMLRNTDRLLIVVDHGLKIFFRESFIDFMNQFLHEIFLQFSYFSNMYMNICWSLNFLMTWRKINNDAWTFLNKKRNCVLKHLHITVCLNKLSMS